MRAVGVVHLITLAPQVLVETAAVETQGLFQVGLVLMEQQIPAEAVAVEEEQGDRAGMVGAAAPA